MEYKTRQKNSKICTGVHMCIKVAKHLITQVLSSTWLSRAAGGKEFSHSALAQHKFLNNTHCNIEAPLPFPEVEIKV
jgi:hypothetical protein